MKRILAALFAVVMLTDFTGCSDDVKGNPETGGLTHLEEGEADD